MSISIRCPKCSQISQALDRMGGSVFTCPACGASLRVPAVAGAATQASQPAVPLNPFETPPESPAPDSDSVYAAYASPSGASDTAAEVAAMKALPYVYRLAWREEDLEASAALGAVNAVLGVILCLVAMHLVRSLHRRQETKAGHGVGNG